MTKLQDVNAESPSGAGRRQYGRTGAAWVSLSTVGNEPMPDWGPGNSGMSGRAMTALENMVMAGNERQGWLARWSAVAADDTPEHLLSLAREIYPEREIKGVIIDD